MQSQDDSKHEVKKQEDRALPSNQSYEDDYGGVNGEEAAMGIGDQDEEEEKSLNEDYEAGELDGKKDEVIDTNPEGTHQPRPRHGLVEEGPGPDA